MRRMSIVSPLEYAANNSSLQGTDAYRQLQEASK